MEGGEYLAFSLALLLACFENLLFFTIFFIFYFKAHFSCGPLAATGGHYQPDTLPVLEISEPRAEEKPNDVIAEFPFVVGDRVKFVVGLEELREMSVDCGLGWSTLEKKVINFLYRKCNGRQPHSCKVRVIMFDSLF
jgi:hypothetical protein